MVAETRALTNAFTTAKKRKADEVHVQIDYKITVDMISDYVKKKRRLEKDIYGVMMEFI